MTVQVSEMGNRDKFCTAAKADRAIVQRDGKLVRRAIDQLRSVITLSSA